MSLNSPSKIRLFMQGSGFYNHTNLFVLVKSSRFSNNKDVRFELHSHHLGALGTHLGYRLGFYLLPHLVSFLSVFNFF